MKMWEALRRKSTILAGVTVLAAVAFVGCSDDDDPVKPEELAPPTNLAVINGDQAITLEWDASPDEGADDFKGYNIYQHTSSIKDLPVSQLAQYKAATVNPGVETYTIANAPNGTRFYLHVRSEKDNGDLSGPTSELQAAARPEGTGIIIEEFASSGDSGFDFSEGESVSLSQTNDQRFQKTDIYLGTLDDDDSVEADLALKNPKKLERLNDEWSTIIGKVRRLGTNWDVNTTDTDDANWFDQEEVSVASVYAVRTPDNHYGKIQITSINESQGFRAITFKYAYQPTANLIQF